MKASFKAAWLEGNGWYPRQLWMRSLGKPPARDTPARIAQGISESMNAYRYCRVGAWKILYAYWILQNRESRSYQAKHPCVCVRRWFSGAKPMNVCKTCRHPMRYQIDRLLLNGDPVLPMADKYGLTRDSLGRHKAKCLPALVARAAEGVETADDIKRLVQNLCEALAGNLAAVDRHGLTDHKVRQKAVETAVELSLTLDWKQTRCLMHCRFRDLLDSATEAETKQRPSMTENRWSPEFKLSLSFHNQLVMYDKAAIRQLTSPILEMNIKYPQNAAGKK
jgi:hypothetical protein